MQEINLPTKAGQDQILAGVNTINSKINAGTVEADTVDTTTLSQSLSVPLNTGMVDVFNYTGKGYLHYLTLSIDQTNLITKGHEIKLYVDDVLLIHSTNLTYNSGSSSTISVLGLQTDYAKFIANATNLPHIETFTAQAGKFIDLKYIPRPIKFEKSIKVQMRTATSTYYTTVRSLLQIKP